MKKSYLGIGILSMIAGLLMLFSPDAWIKVVVILLGLAAIVNGCFNLFYVRRIFDDDYSDGISSKGYVITTLEAAIYCLENTTNYRDAVLKAVNLGEDTDTVAAVCGGLAGIYYGYEDIPVDWISEIDQIQSIIDLCENYEVVCYEYL